MTLVLLDTNTYLRLAKRIRPLLGVKFGQREYVLTVLRDVQDEVRRSPRLKHRFPWFDDPGLCDERDARQVRLTDEERRQLESAKSVLRAQVLEEVERYTSGGRHPPSDTDCRLLAFGQIREAIVVTDDLGMHLLAGDFDLPIRHGWELLDKLRSAKKISNELIREIYEALQHNEDLPVAWQQARHSTFVRIFGRA